MLDDLLDEEESLEDEEELPESDEPDEPFAEPLDEPFDEAPTVEDDVPEPRLSVRLWAERIETAQKLERQFTPLRQRLAACGVLLDQLSCQVGIPHPPGSSALLLKATA